MADKEIEKFKKLVESALVDQDISTDKACAIVKDLNIEINYVERPGYLYGTFLYSIDMNRLNAVFNTHPSDPKQYQVVSQHGHPIELSIILAAEQTAEDCKDILEKPNSILIDQLRQAMGKYDDPQIHSNFVFDTEVGKAVLRIEYDLNVPDGAYKMLVEDIDYFIRKCLEGE